MDTFLGFISRLSSANTEHMPGISVSKSRPCSRRNNGADVLHELGEVQHATMQAIHRLHNNTVLESTTCEAFLEFYPGCRMNQRGETNNQGPREEPTMKSPILLPAVLMLAGILGCMELTLGPSQDCCAAPECFGWPTCTSPDSAERLDPVRRPPAAARPSPRHR